MPSILLQYLRSIRPQSNLKGYYHDNQQDIQKYHHDSWQVVEHSHSSKMRELSPLANPLNSRQYLINQSRTGINIIICFNFPFSLPRCFNGIEFIKTFNILKKKLEKKIIPSLQHIFSTSAYL
jgi:hypothetical protein